MDDMLLSPGLITTGSTMKFTPRRLSFAVLCALSINHAVAEESKAAESGVETLEEVKVKASADANAKGLM